MKKFVVLLAVVAMTCFSAVAFAADVTVGGSLEVRSRDFTNLKTLSSGYDNEVTGSDYKDTQERIRIDVNAKAGDVKGKIELEQDFNTGDNDWGTGNDVLFTKAGLSGYSNSTDNGNLGFREAWINFNLPGIPVNVTAGHQLLALGNGWFFKNMHYGDDAWVAANQTGANTFAVVDVKVMEGNISASDDIDAYAALDVIKLSDNMTVGVDLAQVHDRRGVAAHLLGYADADYSNLYNLGVNMNAKFGALGLKFQGDKQAGQISGGTSKNPDFKGYELVLQGNVALDPVTVNFTAAQGSGKKAGDNKYNGYVNYLDIDPHYTFLYEYKVKTATGLKNTGFSNTTALSAGVAVAPLKSLTVGLDYWYLRATSLVAINGAKDAFGGANGSRDVGQEIDLKVNWQLYDNLAWNWALGYFKPGSAYDNPTTLAGYNTKSAKVTGIQGILAFKF